MTYKITGVLGLKVLSRKQELRFFGSVPLHFQTYNYGLLCISGATEALGANSRNFYGRARKAYPWIWKLNKYANNKCTVPGPTRRAGANTSSKAMDTLGVMIAVVPVVRTTGLGDLQNPSYYIGSL